MVIALKLSVAFALLVSMICCVLNAVLGRHLSDPLFQRNRQFIKICAYALVFYQLCAFNRFTTNRVEILDTPSMLALYLYIEAVCFAVLAHFDRNDYRKVDILLTYNNAVVFFFAMYLYVYFIMGFHDEFYSWDAFMESYRMGYITFFTHGIIMATLLVFIGQFLFSIRAARKAFVAANGIDADRKRTAANRILQSWLALSLLLILGQSINLMAYHLLMSIAIVAVNVLATSHIVRIVHAESRGMPSKELSQVHKQLQHWLTSKPFPLRQSVTMDDIAQRTGIDRDELSEYIYTLKGQTFTGWVRDQRLEFCRLLLRTTELTLSQIAYESGYGELAAMSKAFKKKYGAAPSSYRKV